MAAATPTPCIRTLRRNKKQSEVEAEEEQKLQPGIPVRTPQLSFCSSAYEVSESGMPALSISELANAEFAGRGLPDPASEACQTKGDVPLFPFAILPAPTARFERISACSLSALHERFELLYFTIS